ncbi:MAG: F0F1 ATP synthase subunit delta [Candidatus Omnitrophica bacterium]|nr:F0F1 ATP synthase subunit delta [Candidatus Omnitrophota bacterium]
MLIVQIVILNLIVFTGLILFLKKIFYSDTESALKRLEGVYQDLLKKQKDLTQKIEGAEKEYVQKKEEAVKIVDKLKSDAMDEMRSKKDDMVKSAKSQAEEIINKARASTDEAYKKIEQELSRKMIDTAAELVGSALSPKTCTVLHVSLIKEFFDRGKDFDLSSVGSNVDKLTVRTAFPLSKEDNDKLLALMTQKLNRAVTIEERVDTTVIAGIVLLFGTLILDGSLANYVRDAAEKAKQEL